MGLVPVVLCLPRGWRTWWPAPFREALLLCRELNLLCLLLSAWLRPVRQSWCTVYVVNTSWTSLIISFACLRWTCCLGAGWMALHVVGVSLFCEAGECCVSGLAFGTRQLWWPWVTCLAAAWEAFEFVHYCVLLTLCVFNVWTLVATSSGTGSVILEFGSRWVWGRGPRGVVPGLLGGRSNEWMPAVLMFTYRNLMHVGHRSAVLCLLVTLFGICPHAASGSDREWLHKSERK